IPAIGPGTNQWVLAQTEGTAVETVRQVLASQRFPAYFGVSVEIAGKSLAGVHGRPAVLASSLDDAAEDQPIPDLRVKVHLSDSLALYAQQRLRTFWFGSLIALSFVAVFV